jgi:hypothetical protein
MNRVRNTLIRITRLGIRIGTAKDTEGLKLSCRLAHSNGLAGLPRGNLPHGRQYVQKKRRNSGFCNQ